MLYFNHEAVVSITTMQILTNHRPRSHITTTATNDSALWFSITARFPNTVVISYNIGVISSTNDATSGRSPLLWAWVRIPLLTTSFWFFSSYFIWPVLFTICWHSNVEDSRVAQWKRAGPITQRSVDRNHALLSIFNNFASALRAGPLV